MMQAIAKVPRKGPVSQDGIAYQGRKAARTGSEQRRRAILEATLRIIIRDGIRAVRHRAVAAEAQVPLSATTYYFKDIHDLIADAFTLFVEMSQTQKLNPVWARVDALVASVGGKLPAHEAGRHALAASLGQLCAEYIELELREHRDQLLAEQAFFQGALHDARLRGPALAFRQAQKNQLVAFLTALGTKNPVEDGEMIEAAFLSLEHEYLLRPIGQLDKARIERLMSHNYRLIFRE